MRGSYIFTDTLKYAEAVVGKLRNPRDRPLSRIEVSLEDKGSNGSGEIEYIFFAQFISPKSRLTYESPQMVDEPLTFDEQRVSIESNVSNLKRIFYEVYYALPFSFNPKSNEIKFVSSEGAHTY